MQCETSNSCKAGISCFFSNKSSGTVPQGPPSRLDELFRPRTDCKSPRTIEYYESNLRRFLWYAEEQEWSDDVRLITEWHIREFLAYTGGEGNRWGLTGNGSESSRPKAIYCAVHHYYCVLKAFFNWCERLSATMSLTLLLIIRRSNGTAIGSMLLTMNLKDTCL